MKRGLQPAFRAILADTEQAIKDAVEDPTLQSILFDLESVGEGARDGVEVLQEIRAIRDDIVLVAMTGRGITACRCEPARPERMSSCWRP